MKTLLFLFLSFNLYAHECLPVKPIESFEEVLEQRIDQRRLSGDHVGNGGGLSESNFALARLRLADNILNCLSSKLCLETEKELNLAKDILNSLKKELSFEGQLIFVEGQKDPSFFFLDGNIRVAKTGSSIGDNIYINKDLIYDSRGRALSISRASAILFHEFGHHIGFHDHDYLDMVGSKLGLFISRETSVLETYYKDVKLPRTKNKLVEVTAISFGNGVERLTVSSKNQNFDLTDDLLKRVKIKVEKSCLLSSSICKSFLDVENGNYSPDVYYFKGAKLSRIVTSKIDRKYFFLDLEISMNSTGKFKKAESEFYHLKSEGKYRIRVNRVNNSVEEIEFRELKINDHFGLKF